MILKYKLYYINTILFLFFIFPTIFTLSDECINRGGVCQEKSSCVGNYIPIPGHCEGEESIQCCIENHHTPSENIIDIIKNFEGLRTKAYKCVAGVWTIGYGTTSSDSKITGINILPVIQIQIIFRIT